MESAAKYDQIVLFGDSITEQSCTQDRGFAFMPALQNEYIRRLDVINRGFSGYNTTQALEVLPHILPHPSQSRIRLLTVFFGANDACLKSANNGQHVSLDTYKANLIKLLTHPAVTAHDPRIILITAPPLEERKQRVHAKSLGYTDPELIRRNTVTAQYVEAALEVGEQLEVPVLDLFRAFLRRAGWCEGEPYPGSIDQPENEVMKDLLIDGLHFDGAGYRAMFEEVMKLIADVWPDQTPENLPYVWERWDNTAYWAQKGIKIGNQQVLPHE